MIRVIVVDNQELFRVGLRSSLKRFSDIALECEASDAPTAMALMQQHAMDVALVDVWLPGMDGIELADLIRLAYPRVRILLVSGFFDETVISRGLRSGVHGIISKRESAAAFADFIRRIHAGEPCFSESLPESAVHGRS